MSAQFWSSRPSQSRRPTRLAVEPLEAREVPATFVATRFDDPFFFNADGLSLRQAISRANANPGPDTIVLRAGTYTQSLVGNDNTNAAGDFDVTDSVAFVGAGPGVTVIKGNHNDRLFDVLGPVTVSFNSLSMRDAGSAVSNGGAVQALSANITLNNVFVANMAGALGGAVNDEGGAVTVRNSRLVNNRGDLGGAIRVGSGSLLLDHSAVVSNFANRGGGIFSQTGNVTLSASTVKLNSAGVSGGGVNDEVGTVTLSGSSVVNNLAVGNGGGIFASTANLTNSTVSGNRSTRGSGGGIAAAGLTLTGSVVNGNSAHAEGGGVFLGIGSAALTGSAVNGNSAGGGGGGISAENGSVTMTASTVKNNVAVANGGGGISTRSAALTDSTVSGNRAGNAGGGISTGTATLTNSTVSDNTAATIGGGILAGISASLGGSTVSGNTAGADGGGVFASTTNLTNSTVSGNTAGTSGRGEGGGVFAQHGTFLNSTIVENRTVGADIGAGVASRFGLPDPIRVRNTIIAQNMIIGGEQDVTGFFASAGNNLIGVIDGASGGFGAAGDQSGTFDSPLDPLLGDLANNGGPTKTHALLAGSPAIDAGNNLGAPAIDQRGVARPRDGNGDGRPVVDIGAFER